MVIKDSKGNEFVWIPVNDFTTFQRTTTYNGIITRPDSKYTEPFSGGIMSLNNDLTGEWKEEAAMRESVKKHGGFYLARYEAGLPEGKSASNVKITDIPVSKKGVTVWGNISWGTSMTEVGESGAVYYSRQMYKDSNSVVSTLVYGVQWDAALCFVSDVLNPNVPGKKYVEDSTDMDIMYMMNSIMLSREEKRQCNQRGIIQ